MWLWHISVLTLCHVLSSDFFCVRLVHFFSFFIRLHAVETFFVPFPFLSTLYPILSPSIYTLNSILSPPISMLESISSWFDLNLTKLPTISLVEGGPIWRVSTCFHPIITSRKSVNRDSCRYLVKRSARICSVLQYAMDICLLSTLYLAKNQCTSMCLEFLVHNFFPLFSIFNALWLSWNIMFRLMSYPCALMNKQTQMLYIR